jgi:hypothetical protein
MASVNEKHFKAGGGNAAVKKLLAAQAGAARQLTGASQSSQQTAKPTEAQLARLRARVAARGKAELDRQSKESDRKEASETTYSGNKVYRNGKHIGNMVNGKLVKLGEGPKRDPKIKKQQYPVTIGTVEDKKKDPPKATTSTPPRTSPPRSTPPRTTSSSSSSSSSSSTPPRRSSATRGYTMKADLGKLLNNKPKTTEKPKSRLEKALSWASDKKNKDAWKGEKK